MTGIHFLYGMRAGPWWGDSFIVLSHETEVPSEQELQIAGFAGADALTLAAVALIREAREALGLSKRLAALPAKISPSQWGQVERQVNGSKEVSNMVTMGLPPLAPVDRHRR